MRALLEPFDVVARHLAAMVFDLLPRRLWPDWDGRLPLARMALASALATFLLGFAVGVPAFLRYASQAGRDVSDTMLETAHAVNAGRASGTAMAGSYAVSMLALPAFVLFTPAGWLASYLVGTGLLRSVACATGDAQGDPLIAALDHGARRLMRRRRLRRSSAEREASEGPQEPDVLLTGREGGAPEAVYVVVSSRLKPGWDEGTFVITGGEAWYRLGAPFDRRYPRGLRRVYPLIEPAPAEVIRRQVRYELPALSESYPAFR